MPNFDKNLSPLLTNVQKDVPILDNPSTSIPDEYAQLGGNLMNNDTNPIFGNGPVISKMLPTVSAKELYDNRRFSTFDANIVDIEDQKAYAQSNLDKATNGVLKGLNLAATTIAGSFAMLGGVAVAATSGRLADIWDNAGTRALDDLNTKVDQEYLPNYYTDAEKNAAWYSTDNWFKTNFLFDKLIKNSGFAVGAMVTGNIANAGLLRAGAAVGKFAAAGATAAEASQAFKLFTPLLRNTARAFSAGKNIEAAAILEKEISSIADLSAKSSKLANIARTTNQFAGFGDEARRTIIGAYSSAGEASFEALGTAKEYRNNLIEQWKETHGGAEPTGQDLQRINTQSESVGKTSFLGNLALLGITEYVQLPKQLGSTYSSSKQAANSLLGVADDVVLKEGKYVAAKTEATTLKGKLYEGSKRLSSKLLTGKSTYLFDPKEGLQEGLQFALQVGTQNYYNKAYQTNDAEFWTDGFLYGFVGEDKEGKGVGAFVSKEGMESIALGGVTGGLMQIKGNIQQTKALKSGTQSFIGLLDNAPTFKAAFKDKLASANRGIVLQQQQQDAVINNDKLEALDLDSDMTHNYLAPRIKYGRFDMVMGDIQDLKQQGITEEGLSQLKEQGLANINDTIESYQKRLTSFEKVAANTNELYKSTNLRYSGEILRDEKGEPVLDMDGRQQKKYSPEVIDKMIYAASKVANYDVRIPQVNSILSEYGINTGDVLQSIIENNKPNREATDAVLKQINEMKGVTSTTKEELKTALADVIELSLRRNLFLEEYDSIKDKPLNYETKPDFVFGETEEVPVTVTQKDEDNKPVERKLEIGKEYSLKEPVRKEGSTLQLAPKLKVISQTLGGELEVLLPNGKVKFITPTEFKEYMISDEDNTSEEMANILDDAIDVVLQKEEYKDIPKPVGNKLAFINDLDNQKLINDIEKEFNSNAEEILKNKKEAEELEKQIGKNQEDINKEQKEIEVTSGDVQTQDVNSDEVQAEISSNSKEGKLRSADRLFGASITASEGSESPDYQKDPTQSANYIQRARKFLNNARNSPNRSKMRAIFVTYKNEAALGLKGITQLSYLLNDSDLDTEAKQKAFEKDVTDVNNGFLAQVFVVQEGADFYFIDEKGDRIKVDGKDVKVGDQVDIRNQVVFQAQPTTRLEYRNGDPRYRKNEKAKAEAYQAAYIKYRKDLFESPANAAPPVFKFIISRGVAIEPTTTKKDANGKDVVVKEKNHVGGVLVPENLISSQQGLIVVPTTGSIEHNGELLKFPNGVPVLQYEDVLQFLNNRKFTSDEANTLYEVINALANETVAQVKAKKPIKFNPAYKEFIKNVLYWKSKQKDIGENQFYISGTNINIGKKSFPIATIANNKDEIIDLLENTFANLNNETLSKKFRSPFYEYFVNADGKLETREWKNYQTYLLGASYPDGSPRTASSAPLSTSVAKPNDAFPYSFKSKYSILLGMDLPIKEAAPVAPVAPAAAPVTTVKIGGYEIGGETPQTYKLKAGNVQFVAKLNDAGDVSVEVLSGETTKKAATDPTYVANAIANLKKIAEDQKKEYNEELSKPENAEAAVMAFQGAAISGALEKIRTEEKAAVPTVLVSNKELENKIKSLPDTIYNDIRNTGLFLDIIINKIKDYKKGIDINQQGFVVNFSNVDSKDDIKLTINSLSKEGNNYRIIGKGGVGAKSATYNFLVSSSGDIVSITSTEGKTFSGETGANIYPTEAIRKSIQSTSNKDLMSKLAALNVAAPEAVIAPETRMKNVGLPQQELEAKKADVILPIGTSGSGKSTFIKSLPQKNLVVISPDDMRVEFTGDVNDKSKDEEIYIEAAKRAIQSIKDGKQVVFDTTNLTKEKRRPFIEAVKKAIPNANIQYKLMELNPELAKQRIKEQIARGENRANVSDETINRHAKSYKQMLEDIKSEGISNYDAELAALEGGKKPSSEEPKDFTGFGGPSGSFRAFIAGEEGVMTDAELQLFKEWHAKNASLIPFEVLDNLITIHGTKKAWGVFENGVAKFVKGGLKGTEYHEIFHGIFKGLLSEEKQQALIAEVNAKEGTFRDRMSDKEIEFSKATPEQAEDYIADQFVGFRLGKIKVKSLSERIVNFFKSIVDFVKSFVGNPSLKDELFKAIDAGKFKDVVPVISKVGPTYRAATDLTEQQTHEFVEDMTARAAGIIYNEADKKALFNPLKITSDEMFGRIEAMYESPAEANAQGVTKREFLGDDAWNELVVKTKESLRTLGINFNEDDRININSEGQTNRLYAPEPFSTDWKKTSPFAIKFSLATLFQVAAMNQENNLSLEMPKPSVSTVGGFKLINFSRAFATILDKLSNTSSISKAVDKLAELASYDATYVRLFNRIGGSYSTDANGKVSKVMNFDQFNNEDWRLFIQMIQTFTKQKPEALIQYKSGNTIHTAPANLFTAVKKQQRVWIESMKSMATSPTSFIRYSSDSKTYKVDTEKIKEIPLPKQPQDMIDFLSKLGVVFPMDVYVRLKSEGANSQTKQFADAVGALYSQLGKDGDIYSVTGKALNVDGRFAKLAELYTKVTNPNQDSTYPNVEGETTNAFSENNTPSVFENEFNEADTIKELLKSRPELNDLFSTNSLTLKKGGEFYDENGKKIKEIKIKYIQGTSDAIKNKGITTAKLNLGGRFAQEINQNLNGDYYILIPADSSTEWMINLGNNVSFDDFVNKRADKKIHEIFKGYLLDDVALALDADNRKKIKNIGGKAKELRFFKDILSEKTLSGINELLAKEETTLEDVKTFINKNLTDINESVDFYINNTVDKTIDLLKTNGEIITVGNDEFSYPSLDDVFVASTDLDKTSLSSDEIKNIIQFVNTNYIINNIEMHKIIFGDPYSFKIQDKKGKIILDETKRIKSFLSPRRTTFDFPQFNNYLHRERNLAGGIQLTPDDPGYQNFKSYTDTVTFADVYTADALANTIPLYGETKEADGMSWLMDGTYKEIKLKNGQWTDEAEAFHQWQMAFTRQNFTGYKYSQDARGEALKKHDAKLTSKPSPKHVIEVLKPIVTGVKSGSSMIDNILDKTSQMPIYYSMVKGKTLEKLYVKMFNEKIGYAIVESGRKVGAEELHSLYNVDGSFNDTAFNNRIPVSWKSYGIQVETTQSGEKMQTLGSQITKMSSMDLFENGVASPEAKDEYKRNMKILNEMHRNAYSELLKKLGITDTGSGFKLKDKTAISNALIAEMLRREMSDNAKDTIKLDENKQFRIPFEASPSYVQIRNIIYSMIDKAIISPKVSGGAHVQVPVTGFEKATEGRSLIMKNAKGVWEKISKEKYATLDDDQKTGVMLSDDTLKFYEDADGKRHCEIMVPHWFKSKFGKKTDKEILEYLNKKENQSILRGIGFRIPSQAMSSIEVFKVVGFLPQYMGATVVVPSQITTKAGSDFDIDKLNMYLKSIYVDASGNVKLVQYQGSEEATKEFFSNIYEKTIQNKIDRIGKFDEFRDRMLSIASQITTDSDEDNVSPESILSEDDYEFYLTHIDILEQIDEQAGEKDMDTVDYINSQITNLGIAKDKLTAELLSKQLKDDYVSDMYKRSLENEYYDSLEKLVTLPENFKRLISPLNEAGLNAVADELDALTGTNENNIKNRILDRNYMTSLRHAFVVAKKWVGIAAVNITNHSLAQKAMIYISPSRIKSAPKADRKFLKDGSMILPHNTVNINGEDVISLSGRTVKNSEQLISERLSGYTTAFVDVAKDPYIMKLIKSDLIVGTFMFLERVGAGKAGVKFLNQPIISEYIAMLDRKNIKNLFNDDNINIVKSLFATTDKLIESVGVDVTEEHLNDNIKNYYTGENLTPAQNAEQHNILNEFLKYAKMAEYNFKFTQATNYDTNKFRSGDTLSRKQMRTSDAIKSNIISSVSDIMNNSSIGEQERLLSQLAEATGTIFKLEENQFRVIIDSVLKPYKANEYMSQDNYEKIANKIRASFLDYVVQIQKGINEKIKPLLVDVNTSVANQLAEAKIKYPNVRILNDLEIESSSREGGAKTVKLNVNLKDAYDENLYTGMMAELRDNPNTKELFNNLVTLSLLQGTYQSAVSIKNIIPIEDYSAAISPIISSLQPTLDVKAFGENGSFQRTNFRDDEIMPVVQPKFFLASELPVYAQTNQFGEIYADIFQYYSSLFPNIKGLNVKSTDRRVLKLSEKYNSYDLKNEFVKIPRVVTDRTTGESVDMMTGETITAKDFAVRKQKGDTTLNDYFGYKRVRFKGSKEPLISYNEYGEPSHIYKLINLTGDGQYGVEHYTDNRKSVINNGTIKMNNELSDEDLINYYGGEPTASDFVEGVIETAQPSTSKSVADIPQNKVSGIESFGSLVTANNDVIKALGSNPHSIDMIEAGYRTRTTRSDSEMQKYKVKVGDVVKHFGKSADGTTKTVYTKVTAIHPKGSPSWKGTWEKEGWRAEDVNVIDRFKDGAAAIEFEVIKPTEAVSGTPKGEMVKEGVYVNQEALTKQEQLELFNYLKPFLEQQAAKTLKSANASKMIGLGLRWDYKSNNPGKGIMNIPDVIQPGNKDKYAYYNTSINGQPLGQITPRFKELMEKATGVDMTNYDGAIINLYDNESFISSHNDVDESRSALKYPVIGINLGGTGNFSIESRDGSPKQLNLKAGTGYVFGVDGKNRAVFHRTFPGKQDSFLPELTTNIDGKTYEPGSYRVTITMRRVMPLEPGMPTSPIINSTEAAPAEVKRNAPVEKTYTNKQAASMTAKEIYKQVDELDNPTDARSLALSYFAGGNKISPETLYNEVITRRDSRLVPTGAETKKEISARDYVEKNAKSIKEIAHSIWDNLSEELQSIISIQDIRDELIDVVQSFNKRVDIAKEYLDKYSEDQRDAEAEFYASKYGPSDVSPEDRQINVNQFNITVTPDGTMYYDNGKEVTDQTIKNKVNIRKELQDGTLRTSVYNNSNYFVLLDGRVLGSGKSNLGKESITDPKIKEAILAKAVTYRKQC